MAASTARLGIGSVPGEGAADSLAGRTVDSRERFYNAIFFGYGVAWLWAARQNPVPALVVRALAGFMFLGGIGRVISLAQYGSPHWFQIPLTVIELVVPPVFVRLTIRSDKLAATSTSR
ncbi:DUF4345 domain-containing protein [Actinoplanes bogorensis]|uniref:DUF4345 domain-containing protein n=1 Tax=Paractinoplanes bogorensis TaxID=1610840 RepID=A0ABS5YT32_9ACTN|nr:DUF4345 domain-containing protein [Actinoplanes bogorensis]MBU2666614.1 DUF4345 domain-containing protein [Actinoplanes bogorensis]